MPPSRGQDFCKRQINYMALCLQALPTALHHVKPRSGGEGVPAGANPPAGRVCQRMLTHPGKGYSYLPPSAASDSRHSLSQRTTVRRGAPGRVCQRVLTRLLEELEDALGLLVGLGQHGLGGLNQHVHLGVVHHFLGHIGVTDTAVGGGQVLNRNVQVVDGML